MSWKLNENRPIWIQCKEQLGKQIISGRYQCGQRLPSVRDLALTAGVNPNTMQRALAALDQEGLTVSNRTSGRCVTADEAVLTSSRLKIAKGIILQYLDSMTEMGYSRKEAADLAAKEAAGEPPKDSPEES